MYKIYTRKITQGFFRRFSTETENWRSEKVWCDFVSQIRSCFSDPHRKVETVRMVARRMSCPHCRLVVSALTKLLYKSFFLARIFNVDRPDLASCLRGLISHESAHDQLPPAFPALEALQQRLLRLGEDIRRRTHPLTVRAVQCEYIGA